MVYLYQQKVLVKTICLVWQVCDEPFLSVAPHAYFDAPHAYFDAPHAYFDAPHAYFDAPHAYFDTPQGAPCTPVEERWSKWRKLYNFCGYRSMFRRTRCRALLRNHQILCARTIETSDACFIRDVNSRAAYVAEKIKGWIQLNWTLLENNLMIRIVWLSLLILNSD